MSDPNKYINHYIENSLSMVHEHINLLLTARTQCKMLEDQIANMNAELERFKTESKELEETRQNARNWEQQYNGMKNKVEHMDTLFNQVSDMKKRMIDLQIEKDKLQAKVDKLELKSDPSKSPKKGINKDSKAAPVSNTMPVIETARIESVPEDKNDDF